MCNDYEQPQPPILWDELMGNQGPTSSPATPAANNNNNAADEPYDHHLVSSSETNNVCGFPIWQGFVEQAIINTLGHLTIDDLDEYDLEQAFVDGATAREAAASVFASDKLAIITIPEDDIKARFDVDKLFMYG